MNVSYGGKYENTQRFTNIAVHTDICTPLATNPTWSKLKKCEIKELIEDGFKIWVELVEKILRPSIILISISENCECFQRSKERYELGERKLLKRFYKTKDGSKRAKAYDVYYYVTKIKGKNTIIVYGPPAQTPFGKISNDKKSELGEKIKEKYKEVLNFEG